MQYVCRLFFLNIKTELHCIEQKSCPIIIDFKEQQIFLWSVTVTLVICDVIENVRFILHNHKISYSLSLFVDAISSAKQ